MLASNARCKKMVLAWENAKQESLIAVFAKELEIGFVVVNLGPIEGIVMSTSGDRLMVKFYKRNVSFRADSMIWIETL